ncbi:MAG: hypothetical protein HY954_13135 [Deltaproteobacteria bacterium]|nr:hypothetical protein [Deltaproteobacteria bacterium]
MYFRIFILLSLMLAGCVQMSPRYMKGTEYERALFLYENGKLKEALDKASSVPRESEDYKSAKKLIADINTAHLQIARRHMELAEDLERAGIFRKAIEEYKTSLEYNPSNILAKNKVQTLTGALKEAGNADNKNVVKNRKKKEERDDPEYNANLHYMRGRLYMDSKVWGKAVEEFNMALKYVAPYMNTRELLSKCKKERDKIVDRYIKNGIAYFQAEEMELATKEWDAALELDPANKTAADYKSRAEVIMNRLKNIKEKQVTSERPL